MDLTCWDRMFGQNVLGEFTTRGMVKPWMVQNKGVAPKSLGFLFLKKLNSKKCFLRREIQKKGFFNNQIPGVQKIQKIKVLTKGKSFERERF